MKRDNFMMILLISSAALTVHQWVMESGISEGLKFLPKRARLRKTVREREREGKRGMESAELYDWQLKGAKVEKKGGKTEIFSLLLNSFVLSSCPIPSSHFFLSFLCSLSSALPAHYKNSAIMPQT